MSNKRSFFEKLTGNIKFTSDDTIEHDDAYLHGEELEDETETYEEDEDEMGELSVDMYQINGAIILKAMVAGVPKSDIDITLTRDMVSISGSRSSKAEAKIERNFYQELYWGGFERTIELPEEIDIEEVEAHEQNGLLTLILPLVDKDKQARIKIK